MTCCRTPAGEPAQRSLRIGPVRLRAPFFLAPLSGITDLPFRLLNRQFGCGLAFTEMISAEGLVRGDQKTLGMLASSAEDRPLGVQLYGSNPDTLSAAVEVLSPHRFDIIDFNAACPVKKVTGKGQGASLLKNPAKLEAIVKAMAARADVPVTVKIRAGWDRASVNAPDIALRCRDAGAAAVTVHGRTRSQKYNGTVDYSYIEAVRNAVDIPVIGSGDVLSARLALKMMEETGCSAVAVARGALGNPWIFGQITCLLDGRGSACGPAADQVLSAMTRHLESCCAWHGEIKGVKKFRKFYCWYTKGFHGIKKYRTAAFHAETRQEMRSYIEALAGLQAGCLRPGKISSP
jgi:tRNA-dihydrouridine synthase B